MIYNTHAIVIKKSDFRDYDRLLTLYTRDFGKIKAIARGVRKSRAKLVSLSELFVLSDVRIFLRAASGTGRIIGGVILDSNSLIRYNIKSFYKASYISEVLDAMTPDRQPNIEKFILLRDTLSILNRNEAQNKHEFIKKLLYLTGFGVEDGTAAEELLKEHLKYPLKTERQADRIICG